jgi:hypothetical protein
VSQKKDGVSMTFYGKFKYKGIGKEARQVHEHNQAGDNEPVKRSGETPGFESDCNVIERGWVLVESADGHRHQCFFNGKRTGGTGDRVLRDMTDQMVKNHEQTPPVADKPVTEFMDKFRPHDDTRDTQPTACGSCFVYVLAYAMENSIAWKLSDWLHPSEQKKKRDEFFKSWNIDRNQMLKDAFSSEQCDGGFFESLALDMMSVGMLLLSPLKSAPATPLVDNLDRVYPKRIVQLHTEKEIMDMLRTNGPVMIGVDMGPQDPRNFDAIVDFPVDNSADAPKIPNWDYLNHGIVITGWGTKKVNGKPTTPFWTVYNPWGPDYAKKIKRGGGFERFYKYAVAVVPDFCRGYLLNYLQSIKEEDRREKALKAAGCQSAPLIAS